MKPEIKTLNLDIALEEVAKKVRPTAAVYTISPSACATENCGPQCDCCSDNTTCDFNCIIDHNGNICERP